MPFTVTQRTDGDVLSSSMYNSDRQEIADNLIATAIDDISASAAAMGATTDPGESGSESLPTSLAGELERIRFAIQDIKVATGLTSAKWYSTPTGLFTDSLIPRQFAPGTRLLFQQSTAPTGWTKETSATYNDCALRIVTGSVTTGGAVAFSTSFASGASATASYTLTLTDIPGHTHTGTTGGASVGHTHTYSGNTGGQSATHVHGGVVSSSGGQNIGSASAPAVTISGTSDPANVDHTHTYSGTTASNSADHTHTFTTSSSGSGGGHAHAFTSASADLKFADIIIAMKD